MRPVTLAILILVCGLPASAVDVIRVTVSCPGADARKVEQVVITPIFHRINGIDGLSRIESESRNDGSGTVTVYFQPKTDMNLAELRVQNRVNNALTVMPDACRQQGIVVKKLPGGPPQFLFALSSKAPDHDEGFLNNFAMVNVKPECSRVRGVVDARQIGGSDFDMRVWLNPNQLTANKLTDRDVVDSLRRQISPMGVGAIVNGKQSQFTVVTSGQLTKPNTFESVILRANANGDMLRVKDVGRVELGSSRLGFARTNGKPAALVEVTSWPGQVTADKFLIDNVLDSLPPEMSFSCLADRSTDRLLSVEVRLPGGSTLERTAEVVDKTTERILGLPGKPNVFAFGESRESNVAMIFVKAGAAGPTVADVDKVLPKNAEAVCRVGDVPAGETAFPVRVAIWDLTDFGNPDEQHEKQFREVVERVVATLAKDKDVVAPAASQLSLTPQRTIDVDTDKCAQLGVELNDLFATLQTSLGGVHATDISMFGNRFQVRVLTDPQFARFPEDLGLLMVRGAADELISLDKLIKIRESKGPTALVRIEGYRSIVITAASSSGKTSAQVAAKCVKLAQEILPQGYRAKNLTGP